MLAAREGDRVGVGLLRGVHAGGVLVVVMVDVGVLLVVGVVAVAIVELWSLDGEPMGVWGFVGEVSGVCGFVGVVGRRVEVEVEGEAGDSGRRKGEVRGEPNERGEGL